MQKQILERLETERQKQESLKRGYALPGSDLPWRDWLTLHFPYVVTHPFADRHVRLWEWFDDLTPGVKPTADVEVWPRGGAKSSTGELGTARVGARLSRRFCLYVSETQPQADKHVQSVESLLGRLGVERALNRYGASKGWTRDQLRTENGFNVAAMGLDAAGRGAKLDEFRPDLIIFDDIDGRHDTQKTVEKKLETITQSLLPAGSSDCAALFLQNLIQEEGIVARLVDGRADFLHNRQVTVEVAVKGLETEVYEREDGRRLYRITAGQESWAGQNLATCESQINEWGLLAFRREAQQEVGGADGVFFKVTQLRHCKPEEVPALKRVCLAGDLAATEDGGDFTVFVLLGIATNDTVYILAVIRGQWSSDRVREVLTLACRFYLPKYASVQPKLHLPQDPAQAGKDQAQQMRARFSEWNPKIESVSGNKATRAEGFQEQVNKGNVVLVDADLPELFAGGVPAYIQNLRYFAWQAAFVDVLRRFKEDETDQDDDDVDASSDAYTEIAEAKEVILY